MTSANVFNLNSVKQGQVLNANAAKGRSKAENPDAAGVFASLMGSNYSTNFNMPSVDTKINNNVLQRQMQQIITTGISIRIIPSVRQPEMLSQT